MRVYKEWAVVPVSAILMIYSAILEISLEMPLEVEVEVAVAADLVALVDLADVKGGITDLHGEKTSRSK